MFLISLMTTDKFRYLQNSRNTLDLPFRTVPLCGLCGIIIYTAALKTTKTDLIEEDTTNTLEWRNTQLRPRFVLLEITVPVGVDHSYPLHVTRYLFFHWPIRKVFFGWNFIRFYLLLRVLYDFLSGFLFVNKLWQVFFYLMILSCSIF